MGAKEREAVEEKPENETSSEKSEKNKAQTSPDKIAEIGGPQGPEPTRYGDWERKGRCVDF